MTAEASSSTVTEPRSPDAVEIRIQRFDRRFPRGRIMLLLTALVLVLNVTTALRVEKVSQIDEQYWIDHLLRGADFSIERAGVPILQETVREKCARGFEAHTVLPCHPGHLDPRKYGYWHGVAIAGIGRPPFYFFMTGVAARALRATPIDLPPNDSLVTWARLLGSAWLLVGFYFMVRIGEMLGLRRTLLVVALVLVAATPALLHADTIVNPDVTALPSGAAMLLAALAWERRGKGLWLVALAALLGSALGPKNGIGVILVLVYFVLRAFAGKSSSSDAEEPRSVRDYAKATAVVLVALYLANSGWDHLYTWMQAHLLSQPSHVASIVGNPISAAYGNRNIGFWQVFGLRTVFMMLPPFNDIAFPQQRMHVLYTTVAKATEFVAIGALFAVALRDKLSNKVAALGFATLITLLISPSITVLRNSAQGGTFDQPVWRYGLAAMPGVVIVLVAAARTRFAQAGLIALTALLYVSALFVLFR